MIRFLFFAVSCLLYHGVCGVNVVSEDCVASVEHLNFESDNEEKKKIPFTVNWKLNIDFNINYFMRASIYTETIYNENNSKKLQFKENLNLGVNFRF